MYMYRIVSQVEFITSIRESNSLTDACKSIHHMHWNGWYHCTILESFQKHFWVFHQKFQGFRNDSSWPTKPPCWPPSHTQTQYEKYEPHPGRFFGVKMHQAPHQKLNLPFWKGKAPDVHHPPAKENLGQSDAIPARQRGFKDWSSFVLTFPLRSQICVPCRVKLGMDI